MSISIHALLAESDSKKQERRRNNSNFYPRSPCGERPAYRDQLGSMVSISIHALLAESDHLRSVPKFLNLAFLSTLSLRRATGHDPGGGRISQGFLSTLSLRRATQVKQTYRVKISISIHALLAESDQEHIKKPMQGFNFYPRSPCGERPDRLQFIRYIIKFLSTLSLRRAT